MLDGYSSVTAKRAKWEAWSFKIVGPSQVLVTNESYGNLKDDHSYVVTVSERGGDLVPAACECPANQHLKGPCKHRVALETIGGQVVLEAAQAFSVSDERNELLADGGGVNNGPRSARGCDNGQPGCLGHEGDVLPCFDCYKPEVRA